MPAPALITDRRYAIGKASLEGALLACLKEWAMRHPQELIDFGRQMQRERAGLHQKTGMTRHGTMMAMASIPVTLWNLLKVRINPYWMEDPWVLNFVHRNFKLGQFNRSEMVRVNPR